MCSITKKYSLLTKKIRGGGRYVIFGRSYTELLALDETQYVLVRISVLARPDHRSECIPSQSISFNYQLLETRIFSPVGVRVEGRRRSRSRRGRGGGHGRRRFLLKTSLSQKNPRESFLPSLNLKVC